MQSLCACLNALLQGVPLQIVLEAHQLHSRIVSVPTCAQGRTGNANELQRWQPKLFCHATLARILEMQAVLWQVGLVTIFYDLHIRVGEHVDQIFMDLPIEVSAFETFRYCKND